MHNVVDLDEDYEDDGDRTILEDNFEDKFVRPTSPYVTFLRGVHVNRPSEGVHDARKDCPNPTPPVDILSGQAGPRSSETEIFHA